jgi:hypothetical protein
VMSSGTRGCTPSRLVRIAEKCEVCYKLKQDDPVAAKHDKIHVSNVGDQVEKIRLTDVWMLDEGDEKPDWRRSASGHKCREIERAHPA